MINKFISVLSLVSVLIIFSYQHAFGTSIHFKRIEELQSEYPKYELIIYENKKLIAKRVFKSGKTIESEGELPKILNQIVTVKLISPKDDSSEYGWLNLAYYLNGKLIATRIFKDGKLVSEGKIPDGIVVETYEEGEIRNILIFQDDVRNGPVLGLYKNGKIKVTGTYKDGHPIGVYKRYFESGNLMSEIEIKNGRHVSEKEYFEDGRLKRDWKRP